MALDRNRAGKYLRKTNSVVQWINIYPVDSAIQILNNWELIQQETKLANGI